MHASLSAKSSARSRLVAATGVALLLVGVARGQSPTPFDPPPLPQSSAPPSGVRGLAGARPATTAPSVPAGLDEAPPATFVRPQTLVNPAETVDDSTTEPTPIEGSEIIARINGQVVLASDLNWQIDQMVIAIGDRIPKERVGEFRQAMLERQVLALIDTKLLYADFKKTVPAENLPKIEESLGKAFDEMEIPRLLKMLNVKDVVELDAKLRDSGSSIGEVKRQFNEKTIAGEWLKSKLPKEKPVTHEQMLAYYQDHLAEYEFPAQVRWEELMVRFDRFGGDRQAAWEAICALGNEVWAAAQKNPGITGPVFGEIAKAKSHGYTASAGGMHDWSELGSLKCENLNTALATLAPGQLSPAVESEQGFHIVRVLERREAGRTPFTEAQAEIRKQLTVEQKEAGFAEAVKKIRQDARVWTLFHGEMTQEAVTAAVEALQKR
jgi:hypothetical protein